MVKRVGRANRRAGTGLGARVAVITSVALLSGALPGTAGAWVPGNQGPIVYSSDGNVPKAPYTYNLWAVNADGSDRHQVTHESEGQAIQPTWSPSGREIAFAVQSRNPFVAGPSGIRVVDYAGSHEVALTNGLDTRPHFSPDGAHIAYLHDTPSGPGMPLPVTDV